MTLIPNLDDVVMEYKHDLLLRNTLDQFIDSWNKRHSYLSRKRQLTSERISKDIGIPPHQIQELIQNPELIPPTAILFELCHRYDVEITDLLTKTYPLELDIEITATRQDEEPERLERLKDMLENAYMLGGRPLLSKVKSVHDRKGQLEIDWKIQPTALDKKMIEFAWETQYEYLVEHTLSLDLEN
jgi:hypothetical protein